jgi:hypothetical protein
MNQLIAQNPRFASRLTLAPVVRYLPAAGRVTLGLVFFVCGLNGFLNFLPQPDGAQPEAAMALGKAFMSAGYLFPLIAGTEAVGGALLLSNRFVPLALALLAPVIVNILAFHAFLAPAGLGLALVLLAIELCLAWAYRSAYVPMLAVRNQPGRGEARTR